MTVLQEHAPSSKVCNVCGIGKSLDNFHKAGSRGQIGENLVVLAVKAPDKVV